MSVLIIKKISVLIDDNIRQHFTVGASKNGWTQKHEEKQIP